MLDPAYSDLGCGNRRGRHRHGGVRAEHEWLLAAVLIGVLLLLTFVVTTTAGIMHAYRARGNETAHQPTDGLSDLSPSGMGASLWRCQALITEALIIRQRLSGEIDAETYQVRMNALARQAISEGRPQHNA